jgi:hypothetical protein
MPVAPRRCRRGSALLLVVGAAMIVALLGLAGLMSLRIQRRVVENTVDTAEARVAAQAAVEVGLMRIDGDENWRTNYPDGVWISNETVGACTFTLEGHDPLDGDLADDDTEDLVLTGIGVKGAARQKMQVRLIQQIRGVEALEASLFAVGTMNISSATVQSDGILGANDDVAASGATVNADIESGATITGGTYNGSQTGDLDVRTVPPDSVFSPYTSSGVFIDITMLPSLSGNRYLQDLVLSPNSNPYGAVHGQGVYVIDCQSTLLVISNVRIVGTLVLLNVNSTLGVEVADSVNWEAAVANYPALMVDGHLHLDYTQSLLDETATSANYNPAGTPYNSIEDGDTSDSYPSAIRGLIYASGNISTSNHPSVDGSVVAGADITVSDQLDLVYDDIYLTNPPPGFLDKTNLKISAGSWSKDVD